MRCPHCDGMLRAMSSRMVKRDGKEFRQIDLYCKKAGCPRNNGQPVHTDEIEVKHGTE